MKLIKKILSIVTILVPISTTAMEPLDRDLCDAISANNKDRVEQLLDQGAKPSKMLPHAFYCTPLIVAICIEHEAIVQLLLKRGALVNQVEGLESSPPLTWAMKRNNLRRVFYILLVFLETLKVKHF